MDDMIGKLYHGSICPFEEIREQTPEREAALQKYRAAEQRFIEQHPECKDDLEVMLSEFSVLENYTVCDQFTLGFKAGAQLMLEMLRPIK